MRRIEYLINEVRMTTDNEETNSITDGEMVAWFNDSQNDIMSLIFEKNPQSDMFNEVTVIPFDGNFVYDLPDDIYAENAILLVEVQCGYTDINDGYVPVTRISDNERPTFFGYFTRNGQIVFSVYQPYTTIQNFRLTYFKKLKRFDKRWATVSSVAGQVINVTNSDSQMLTIDDKISIVTADGTVVTDALTIVSSSLPTSLTVSGSLTGVVGGMYIVMTDYSTTVCALPDACEIYLKDYVRQRLYTRQNYGDAGKQSTFTEYQQSRLITIFAHKAKDGSSAPITDIEFLDY